jgi:hypothetical protein
MKLIRLEESLPDVFCADWAKFDTAISEMSRKTIRGKHL